MAQSRRVTLSAQNVSMETAFRDIERQTGMTFAFNNSKLDLSRKVTVVGNNVSLEEVLRQLLKGTGHTSQVSGRLILIVPPKEAGQLTMEDLAGRTNNRRMTPEEYAEFEAAVKAYNLGALLEDEPKIQVSEPKNQYDPSLRDTVYSYAPQVKTPNPTGLQINRTGADEPWLNATPSKWSVKTNLLYGIAALAPNLSTEIGLGKKTSLELMGSYNGWKRKGSMDDNKKLVHWIAKIEARYWFCERMNGHFLGLHPFYWQYNVSEHKVPGMFKKEYRYEGHAFGVGISYGYHWMLNRRWGLEFNVGAGVAFMKHDRYSCTRCNDSQGEFKKTYVGPTSAGIKVVYIIK